MPTIPAILQPDYDVSSGFFQNVEIPAPPADWPNTIWLASQGTGQSRTGNVTIYIADASTVDANILAYANEGVLPGDSCNLYLGPERDFSPKSDFLNGYWGNLTFNNGWPAGWPGAIYWGLDIGGTSATLTFSSNPDGTGALATAAWSGSGGQSFPNYGPSKTAGIGWDSLQFDTGWPSGWPGAVYPYFYWGSMRFYDSPYVAGSTIVGGANGGEAGQTCAVINFTNGANACGSLRITAMMDGRSDFANGIKKVLIGYGANPITFDTITAQILAGGVSVGSVKLLSSGNGNVSFPANASQAIILPGRTAIVGALTIGPNLVPPFKDQTTQAPVFPMPLQFEAAPVPLPVTNPPTAPPPDTGPPPVYPGLPPGSGTTEPPAFPAQGWQFLDTATTTGFNTNSDGTVNIVEAPSSPWQTAFPPGLSLDSGLVLHTTQPLDALGATYGFGTAPFFCPAVGVPFEIDGFNNLRAAQFQAILGEMSALGIQGPVLYVAYALEPY